MHKLVTKVFIMQEVFCSIPVLTISSPFALWTGVTNGHKNGSTGIEQKTSCVMTTLGILSAILINGCPVINFQDLDKKGGFTCLLFKVDGFLGTQDPMLARSLLVVCAIVNYSKTTDSITMKNIQRQQYPLTTYLTTIEIVLLWTKIT